MLDGIKRVDIILVIISCIFTITFIILCIQGKVEMTLELLSETEAKSRPAGKGREPPQALPDPLYVT